jgi:hypothetical protein
MNASRVAALPVAIVASAMHWAAAPAHADPPATQQITAVAVGSQGQAVNGYHETPPDGAVPVVEGCTASPSALADDVYSCSPSAAGAATCWPSTPGSLLCVDNPWDLRLHRVSYNGRLPHVQPTASPEPFAVLLDDGIRCLLRNGGSWGGRDDGYVGAYGCGNSFGSNPAVLCLPNQQDCIDRSAAAWTVKVGPLGAPDAHFPPPQTRTVSEAWFAGDRIPG